MNAPAAKPDIDFDAVERLLAKRGVSIEQFCASVEINPSTWRRWRARRHEPHPARLRAVVDEIARLKRG